MRFLMRECFMNKTVTLLGMSGAGKTHFSQRLAQWGWMHYSNDFEIAKLLGIDVNVDDLSPLSDFIGQLGDPDKGGLSLEDFKDRQRQYYDAECLVLDNLAGVAVEGNIVNDSTGSFCEITDETLIARVAEQGVFIYVEADPDSHDDIIARAQAYPKPLFFPPDIFDEWLREFCALRGVLPDLIEPGDFSRWVFPKLFQSRLPKYEKLAAQYGIKVQAKDLHAVGSGQEFLDLIQG